MNNIMAIFGLALEEGEEEPETSSNPNHQHLPLPLIGLALRQYHR